MRVAIIGCGYLGKAAAKAWSHHDLTLFTRSEARLKELSPFGRVVFSIKEALQGQRAVLLSVAPDSPDKYAETYLGCARAVLEHSVPQIIYTSSSSVYGDHGGAIVDEESPLKPTSEREKILVETEKLLQTASCKVCIFRLGEIIGPGRQILDRLRSPMPGTGESLCNLSPIEEIVTALNYALEEGWEGIFNICNDLHIPRRELYEQLHQKAGLPPLIWDRTKTAPHVGNKVMSNNKFKRKIDGSKRIYSGHPVS